MKYAYEKALMEGTSSTTFSPNVDTTRAMIATLLWRMEGSPAPTDGTDFPDVRDDQWYTDAVRWATSAGVVKGYDNGSFGPGDTITREQLALILYRYAEANEAKGDLTAFIDGDSVSDWAVEAMGWAVGQGIMTGKSGKRLDPQGTATRAEVAAVLQRFLK